MLKKNGKLGITSGFTVVFATVVLFSVTLAFYPLINTGFSQREHINYLQRNYDYKNALERTAVKIENNIAYEKAQEYGDLQLTTTVTETYRTVEHLEQPSGIFNIYCATDINVYAECSQEGEYTVTLIGPNSTVFGETVSGNNSWHINASDIYNARDDIFGYGYGSYELILESDEVLPIIWAEYDKITSRSVRISALENESVKYSWVLDVTALEDGLNTVGWQQN